MFCLPNLDVFSVLTTESVLDQYTILQEVIGTGGFGVVKKGIRRSSGEEVAVKIVRVSDKHVRAATIAECECLRALSHPNIIQLYDAHESNTGDYYLFMEMVTGGELFDRIVQKQMYSERDARALIKILLSVIQHCHEREIVHRDIKAENLLLVSTDDDSTIKLCDFGLAVKNVVGMSLIEQVGTFDYMAPEIHLRRMYGAGVDMWAIGVLSFVMLYGHFPFYQQNIGVRMRAIVSGDFSFSKTAVVSDDAKDFISSLIKVDVDERLTAAQALQHPWVSGIGHLYLIYKHSHDVFWYLSTVRT
jgi:serine/threonine protein kinase